MARRHRRDGPGALHHVFNRGIARRTMFEDRRDRLVFMALMAREVRRGEVRVVAFCVMTTHFHMLLQSVRGRLDVAMRRIQTDYSRYFNRRRRRDGPLVRSRYGSRRVDSVAYRDAVMAYIELNPVHARMVEEPDEYEFGSAYLHARQCPSWLLPRDGPPDLDRFRSGDGGMCSLVRVVEARLLAEMRDDALDDLLTATPAAVVAWMRRKARLADGTSPGLPVCGERDVMSTIHEHKDDIAGLTAPKGMHRESLTLAMTCGLLRDLCGLEYDGVADQVARTPSSARRWARKHAGLLVEDESYAALAGRMARVALDRGPFRSRCSSDLLPGAVRAED